MLIFIGIDPGLRLTGYAELIYIRINGKINYITIADTIKVKGKYHSDKIRNLNTSVSNKIGYYDVIAIESIFVNLNWKTTLILAYAKSACLSCIRGEFQEVNSSEIKRAITGIRWYTKALTAVSLSWLLENPNLKASDSTDAIAIAYTSLTRCLG